MHDIAQKSRGVNICQLASSSRDREKKPQRRLLLSFREIDQEERFQDFVDRKRNVQIIVI